MKTGATAFQKKRGGICARFGHEFAEDVDLAVLAKYAAIAVEKDGSVPQRLCAIGRDTALSHADHHRQGVALGDRCDAC